MTNKDKTQAQEALEEVEKTIEAVINLAHKNGTTELAKFKFKDQCETIRKALTILDLLKSNPDVIPVWNENIDEAPRDGVIIDLWDSQKDCPHRIPECAHFKDAWHFGVIEGDSEGFPVFTDSKITHWIAIPTPEQQEILKKIKEMIDGSNKVA